jgi:uncharacterized membrane protein
LNAKKRTGKKKNRLKAFFVRGLLTLLPVVFTVFILVVAFRFVDQYVTGPVNAVIYWALERNGAGWQGLELLGIDPYHEDFYADDLPRRLEDRLRSRNLTSEDPQYAVVMDEWRAENVGFFRDVEELAIDGEKLHVAVLLRVPPVVGLGVSILLVISLGSFAGGIIGRTILSRGDRAMNRIPIVRSIYPYTKQLTDFFLAERKFDFETVVAVEYPRKGLRSFGFVTSSGLKTLRNHTGENLVSVFVPSSPMPMTGYTIFVPAEDLIPLPFTVDEALRTVVSGGVLIPPHEKLDVTASEVMARVHLDTEEGEEPRAERDEGAAS